MSPPLNGGVSDAAKNDVDYKKNVESDATTDCSGGGESQMVPVRTGVSNELDSTALSQYIEPSPDTMDRKLAGAAMDVTSGAKMKQAVPELAGEIIHDSPIGQNFYYKVMKEKKLNLGLNAPWELLRSHAVDGGSGQKGPIPMEISSFGSPLKRTKHDSISQAYENGGVEVKQQSSRREFIMQVGHEGGSPALKQREGTMAINAGQKVHSPATSGCKGILGMPKHVKPGVDEVKQQLSRGSELSQPGQSGRKKVFRSKKNKSKPADFSPLKEGAQPRVRQPLISAFMGRKAEDKEYQGSNGSANSEK